METVYVLGAGASRDAGYPLASQMGDELLDFMLKSQNDWIRASGEFLVDEFRSSPNIEDLITEIQAEIERLSHSDIPEDRARRTRIGNSKGWLGAALREWFREVHLHPALSYAKFADQIVQRGDVVITFNYDDSLERELRRAGKWDVSRGYGFPLGNTEEATEVLVLKLHGSVNWLVSLFGGATGGTFITDPSHSLGNHPVIHPADLQFLGYESFSGHTYQSGGAFPCLIFPGRSKEFFYDTSFGQEFAQFWDHLWGQAATALAVAKRVVICGYSLPGADKRAHQLLLGKPDRSTNIEIVCGGDTARIAREFSDEGFGKVLSFRGRYYADWCQANASI